MGNTHILIAHSALRVIYTIPHLLIAYNILWVIHTLPHISLIGHYGKYTFSLTYIFQDVPIWPVSSRSMGQSVTYFIFLRLNYQNVV